MSQVYTSHNLYPPTISLPNGFATQIDDRRKNKIIFLDVTPTRTPYVKSPSLNSVSPLRDNLIAPKIYKDIVYENIKPVFTLLRVMGVLPLTRPSPGVNRFQFASPSMLYSIFFFLSLISYVMYLSLNKVQILRYSEGRFEEAVIEYLFTVYLFPIVVIPILWYETRKIAGVLNGWVEFEVAYKKLSRRVLPVKLYKKALAISVIIPILSTTSVISTHVTMVHFKLIQILPYIFLEILTYILGGYWYLLCETLSICANILAEDFHQALRHIGPAAKVGEYRSLWLRLSKLARDTGIANCYTFTFVNLYLFLIITLSIYGLLSQISEGFGIKDIGLALTACCSIFLLFFICDEAHYASHNVRTNFQKKLLLVELSWMNTDAQTEVNMFLRATEMNPSQISLGGFFDVNRNLFKSRMEPTRRTLLKSRPRLLPICEGFIYPITNQPLMIKLSTMNLVLYVYDAIPVLCEIKLLQLLATMVTYLVVLLQFQISIPDDSQSVGNSDEKPINETISLMEQTTTTTTTLATTILTTLVKKKKKN